MSKVQKLLSMYDEAENKKSLEGLLNKFWDKEKNAIGKLLKEAKGSHGDKIDYVREQIINMIQAYDDKYPKLAAAVDADGSDEMVSDILWDMISAALE
jgi:hypothetical protein